jgi:hypothetical protein
MRQRKRERKRVREKERERNICWGMGGVSYPHIFIRTYSYIPAPTIHDYNYA